MQVSGWEPITVSYLPASCGGHLLCDGGDVPLICCMIM